MTDEEIKAFLDQPIDEVMAKNPDIEALINVWQQDRIKRALARVLSTPSYALLCVRYSDLSKKTEYTNLESMVLGRIAPRLDFNTMKGRIK